LDFQFFCFFNKFFCNNTFVSWVHILGYNLALLFPKLLGVLR
jgi:hypothetical protein